MKNILGISIAIFFVTFSVTGAFAQTPNNKRFEFSTSASMLNYKYEGGDIHTWINIPLRIGFFVYKGLEIEPELFLTMPTEETDYTGILVMGNISYNFKGSKNLFHLFLEEQASAMDRKHSLLCLTRTESLLPSISEQG